MAPHLHLAWAIRKILGLGICLNNSNGNLLLLFHQTNIIPMHWGMAVLL